MLKLTPSFPVCVGLVKGVCECCLILAFKSFLPPCKWKAAFVLLYLQLMCAPIYGSNYFSSQKWSHHRFSFYSLLFGAAMPGVVSPSLSSSQHNLSFVLRALDRWCCKSLKSRCRQPSQVLQSTNALDMDQHGLDCAHSSMLPVCLNAHFCVFPLSVSLLSLSRPYDTTNQDSQRSRMDEQKVGFWFRVSKWDVWKFSSGGC